LADNSQWRLGEGSLDAIAAHLEQHIDLSLLAEK
jgi:hypothetical protein